MKKLQILLSLMLLSGFFCFSQNPKNLSECNIYFDKNIKPKDIRNIKKISADELKLSYDDKLNSLTNDELNSLDVLATTIKNKWILKNQSPTLVNYFKTKDIFHPNDISAIIIKSYWSHLNKVIFDMDTEVAHHKEIMRKKSEIYEKIRNQGIAAEKKISDSYLDLKYKSTDPIVLSLPYYKNAHSVYSDEFIKYKDGYIINSMTTLPGEDRISNTFYRYYYIDLKTNQLSKLSFKGFDSVQSVITIHSTLYIAGKKNNKLKIVTETGGKEIPLSLSLSGQKDKKLNNKSWIKLGAYKDTLFALQTNGLLFYNGKDWTFKHQFDLDQYFKANYQNSSIIPIENIRLTSKKMYFLQEMLQMRDCSLFEFDLEKKTVSEFWKKYQWPDHYGEDIYTYTSTNDSTFVATTKNGGGMLLLDKDNAFEAYLLDGKVKSDSIHDLQIRKVIQKKDELFLIGEDGLFDLKNNEITRLATFENTEQIIDDGKYKYHFKFHPRSCEMINGEEYLIGGMFGGLYRINLKQKTIICLDDNESLKTIEIFNSHN